jgi:hypothetical protein
MLHPVCLTSHIKLFQASYMMSWNKTLNRHYINSVECDLYQLTL